ncbi:hypothetical protein SORBI_3009G036450 [Sorghum bicolor]|uniref:Uncharacterized protein n=1 Tax=Sorghum bicolor TaxID=4558 RepID=A0A1Z5R1S6_SORBI|nr:hypothetical protein SORBI_3009G036450 [Sorghum bicolor]
MAASVEWSPYSSSQQGSPSGAIININQGEGKEDRKATDSTTGGVGMERKKERKRPGREAQDERRRRANEPKGQTVQRLRCCAPPKVDQQAHKRQAHPTPPHHRRTHRRAAAKAKRAGAGCGNARSPPPAASYLPAPRRRGRRAVAELGLSERLPCLPCHCQGRSARSPTPESGLGEGDPTGHALGGSY